MRIIQSSIFVLAVIFSLVVQAEKSQFTPETVIKKSVENGKVIYGKSGFSDKKIVKKTVDQTVKAVPKITTPKVDIYYAAWDPYSNKAIEFFRVHHVVVNAYDIDLDPAAAARKKIIDPEFVGMPLVIINGVVIRGVNEQKYEDALKLTP